MTYTVVKLDNEPIVIARIFGKVTPDEHTLMSRDVAMLIENIPGIVYRITDTTGATSSFVDMVKMTGQFMKGMAGTASDPRVVTLAVLDDANAYLSFRALANMISDRNRVRRFQTMAEALAYARARIDGQAAEQHSVNV